MYSGTRTFWFFRGRSNIKSVYRSTYFHFCPYNLVQFGFCTNLVRFRLPTFKACVTMTSARWVNWFRSHPFRTPVRASPSGYDARPRPLRGSAIGSAVPPMCTPVPRERCEQCQSPRTCRRTACVSPPSAPRICIVPSMGGASSVAPEGSVRRRRKDVRAARGLQWHDTGITLNLKP